MAVWMAGLAALFTLLAGGLIGWLIAARGAARAAFRVQQLEAEVASLPPLTAERDSLRSELGAVRESLAGERARLEAVSAERAEAAAALAAANARIAGLERDGASLRTAMEAAEVAHAEQVRQLTAMREEIQNQFRLLAGDVLKTSTEDFVKRAGEVFVAQKDLTAAEIDRRSKEIEALVKPLGDSLKAHEAYLEKIEKERVAAYGGLTNAVEAMRTQNDQVRVVTANLVTALKASPKTRGRWGEETLRRVMEMSGMVEHCDFETEAHFRGADESLRPDVIIHLAGGRKIVVDAKAPVTAYLESTSAESEEARDLLLKRHAGQLRERLTNLSAKSYWQAIEGSPECVVMFVPGDNFVAAAFERDPDLFEDAVQARVLICTPTTFIALAKSISYGWRQARIEENAREVARLGKDLYGRLATMGEHIARLGRQLTGTVEAYNRFLGSVETSVLPQARKFRDLGVEGAAEALPEPEPVDKVVRLPQPRRDLHLSEAD